MNTTVNYFHELYCEKVPLDMLIEAVYNGATPEQQLFCNVLPTSMKPQRSKRI